MCERVSVEEEFGRWQQDSSSQQSSHVEIKAAFSRYGARSPRLQWTTEGNASAGEAMLTSAGHHMYERM